MRVLGNRFCLCFYDISIEFWNLNSINFIIFLFIVIINLISSNNSKTVLFSSYHCIVCHSISASAFLFGIFKFPHFDLHTFVILSFQLRLLHCIRFMKPLHRWRHSTLFGYHASALWFHCPKTLKLFGFPIFRYW